MTDDPVGKYIPKEEDRMGEFDRSDYSYLGIFFGVILLVGLLFLSVS